MITPQALTRLGFLFGVGFAAASLAWRSGFSWAMATLRGDAVLVCLSPYFFRCSLLGAGSRPLASYVSRHGRFFAAEKFA